MSSCDLERSYISCKSHLVQTYFLAGLLLTMSLPVPDSSRAAYCGDMKVPVEFRDLSPDDAEPPEGEPSSDEVGLRIGWTSERIQQFSRKYKAPDLVIGHNRRVTNLKGTVRSYKLFSCPSATVDPGKAFEEGRDYGLDLGYV